jgi:hypothetical protein
MEEATVAMLEIEEKLARDADGVFRNEIVNILTECASVLKSALEGGLPSDEYGQLKKLTDAIQAASATVEMVWESFHQQKQ